MKRKRRRKYGIIDVLFDNVIKLVVAVTFCLSFFMFTSQTEFRTVKERSSLIKDVGSVADGASGIYASAKGLFK